MSSDDDDDDFVTFGTALEPLDEAAMPRKKAYTPEDQYVRDSSGRRRFHGAFTGGFSAGFMNTVGSLEGWKPAEFKSTRADRAGAKQQTAADFMDEEDMGEHGIAPSRLTAKMDYVEDSNKRKKPTQSFNDGPIPGIPVLEQLIQNVSDTIGVRLLKSMGWKPGQGVGPRVSASVRREEIKKTYGCEPPPGYSAFGSDDEDLENITLAPLDTKPYLVNPKKDTFGLGYVGLDRRSVLGNNRKQSELKMRDAKGKVNIRGQAFGVGAFEEEDDDIYGKEDMSEYDLTAGGPDPKQVLLSAITAPGVLPGFVQAKHKVLKKTFPLPKIPASFRGRHEPKQSRFGPSVSSSAGSASSSTPAAPAGLGRHAMNAQTRAVLISDPSELADITRPGTGANAAIKTEPGVPVPTAEPAAISTAVPNYTATAGSHRFKPFLQDPDKQKRYELYLNLKDKRDLINLQPVTLNEWEREREQREFEQAARIFRPLTGVMEDRFTRAQQPDDATNPLATVERLRHEHGNETQRNAARMKMYGEFTRDVGEWLPCSLLCKRFNVPEPGSQQPTKEPRAKPKYSIFDSLDALVKPEPASPPRTPVVSAESSATDTVSAADPTVAADEEQPQQVSNEPLFVDPQTKVDLFKAIFLDSSDEEDTPVTAEILDEPKKNTVRNTSPPRGLFANIDLEALACRSTESVPPPPPAPVIVNPPPTPPIKQEPSTSNPETYGPKLPEKIVPVVRNRSESSSSSDEWDVVSSSSHKSKKSKKHKHKSKKTKKKKKKHKKK